MKTAATGKSEHIIADNQQPKAPKLDKGVTSPSAQPHGPFEGLVAFPRRGSESSDAQSMPAFDAKTTSYPKITTPTKLQNQNKPVLIFDSVEPSRFRTTSNLSALNGLNQQGLDRISMTGIEQFSEAQLDAEIARVHPKKVVVIDTRQESHGFVGGQPISWMALDNRNWGNVDKPIDAIEPKEEKKLRKWAEKNHGHTVEIPNGSTAKAKRTVAPLNVTVQREQVETEKELVTRKGGLYIRVPIPDHAAPDQTVLAHLVASTRSVVQDMGLENIHFVVHCRGGMGRTTMGMSALDMLTNAVDVSMGEITDRQVRLRQRDEGALDVPGKEYKAEFREQKKEVLRYLHDYAVANPFHAEDAKAIEEWSAGSPPVFNGGQK